MPSTDYDLIVAGAGSAKASVLLLLFVSALALLSGAEHSPIALATPADSFAIDMDHTGNTATANPFAAAAIGHNEIVGTRQTCAKVNHDGILNFDEDPIVVSLGDTDGDPGTPDEIVDYGPDHFVFDVTVQNIPVDPIQFVDVLGNVLTVVIFDGGDGITNVQNTIIYAPTPGDVDPVLANHFIIIDSEVMKVTARDTSTHTLTVERGSNGTTPAAHAEGAAVVYAGGMIGFQYGLLYEDSALSIDDPTVFPGTGHNVAIMLRTAASSNVFEPGPDYAEGDDRIDFSAGDLGPSTSSETGTGVLDRVVMRVDNNAPPGVYNLSLGLPAVHVDTNSDTNHVTARLDARVAVGVDCPPDGDLDGVPEPPDNCPSVPNPMQLNTDGDAFGDACDPDDDNDGIADTNEVACGSDPIDVTPPLSRPERIDGAFGAADDDGDLMMDEALPPGASAFDCDGDGFKGSAEDHVYSYLPQLTGDQKTCQEYDLAHPNPNANVKPSKRWPADLNMGAGSFNRISLTDLTSLLAPIRYFGTNVSTNPADVRFDLVPGPGAFLTDINLQDLTSLIAGSTGNPPMLAGARAFGGPVCPWPP